MENDSILSTSVIGCMASFPVNMLIAHGSFYSEDDVKKQRQVAFVNHLFAEQAMREDAAKSLAGKNELY